MRCGFTVPVSLIAYFNPSIIHQSVASFWHWGFWEGFAFATSFQYPWLSCPAENARRKCVESDTHTPYPPTPHHDKTHQVMLQRANMRHPTFGKSSLQNQFHWATWNLVALPITRRPTKKSKTPRGKTRRESAHLFWFNGSLLGTVWYFPGDKGKLVR